MWDLLKKWYKRNRVQFALLLLASIGVGLIMGGACLFFPPAFIAFTSLMPLAFLITMPLPLAILTLTSIMTAVAFGIFAAGFLLIKQLTSISTHVYDLLVTEQKGQRIDHSIVSKTTYDYLQAHLKTADIYDPVNDEYNEEISSNSSDNDEESKSVLTDTTEEHPGSHRVHRPY